MHVWIHDPYPSDSDVLDARTQTVRDNGFNPVWNEVRLRQLLIWLDMTMGNAYRYKNAIHG